MQTNISIIFNENGRTNQFCCGYKNVAYQQSLLKDDICKSLELSFFKSSFFKLIFTFLRSVFFPSQTILFSLQFH
jgi:hypothetical protein